MKIFKLMTVALVAMFGFIACDKHECNDYDHSADLVGTWTCLQEGYAEALVIKADGSAVSTGVENREYWENVAGNIVVKNGTVTMTFEDNDNFKGHFDIVPGVAFSIFTEDGEHMTYNYCKEDLSEEIVGMWVCNDGTTLEKNGITIHTYTETGKTWLTTAVSAGTGDFALNEETEYKVIGNMMFLKLKHNPLESGDNAYGAALLTYTPNATSAGDIMTMHSYMSTTNGFLKEVDAFLRVKQSLDLTGTYDYTSAYVSNAEGTDEDFTIFGHTFNMANIEAGNLDVFLRSELFCVDLNANTIKQYYRTNGSDIEVVIPITVDGNKVTLDLSAENPAFRKVDMHMFQDADNSQLHMYMHTDAFINYFANLELFDLISDGKINPTDAAAVEKVFADMEARIESINVTFVMKARK